MYKSLKTKNHLTTCSANFSRLRKILCNFENDTYTFEILNHEQKNQAEFLVISRTPHTLMIEAKFKNKDAALVNFLLRINIYIDAKLWKKFLINKKNLFHFLFSLHSHNHKMKNINKIEF